MPTLPANILSQGVARAHCAPRTVSRFPAFGGEGQVYSPDHVANPLLLSQPRLSHNADFLSLVSNAMSSSGARFLNLKCGFTAEKSDADGMLWLNRKGPNIAAGISLDCASDLMFDEANGTMSLSAAGSFFLSMPATKGQAENFARMLGADFDLIEKLDPQAEAALRKMVLDDIEELEQFTSETRK